MKSSRLSGFTKDMTGEQRVLVIVVTFNAENWINFFLDPIYDSSQLEVMCIDNASQDNTANIIREMYPDVIFKQVEGNIGFGRANNIGLEYFKNSNHDYVLLLNQDAKITPKSIEELILLMEENPEFGILSPVHRSKTDDSLDFNFSNYLQERNTPGLIADLLLLPHIKDIYPTEFVNAALWCISRSCFDKVGYFDPIFPHYGEDSDYIERLKKAGLKAGIAPKVFGNHVRNPPKANTSWKSLNSYVSKHYATLLVKYKYDKSVLAIKVLKVLRDFILAISEAILYLDFRKIVQTLINYPRLLPRLISLKSRKQNKVLSRCDQPG